MAEANLALGSVVVIDAVNESEASAWLPESSPRPRTRDSCSPVSAAGRTVFPVPFSGRRRESSRVPGKRDAARKQHPDDHLLERLIGVHVVFPLSVSRFCLTAGLLTTRRYDRPLGGSSMHSSWKILNAACGCAIHCFVVDCIKSRIGGMNLGHLTLQPHRGLGKGVWQCM
jgi:hypothetical protein